VIKYAHISYTLDCHLQIYEDPDPAYHFDADPVPDFYLMWMWIRMQIHADPDPQHCLLLSCVQQDSEHLPDKHAH
jgi:hypothetical protein